MSTGEFGEKTEQPTEHRRREERRRGNVARSGEMSIAGHLLATTAVLYGLGASLVEALGRLLQHLLKSASDRPVDRDAVIAQFWDLGHWATQHVLPWMAALVVGAIAFNLIQVGFVLSTEKLGPDFNLLNPVVGLRRLFSLRSLMTLAVSLTKLAVLLGIAGWFIASELPILTSLSSASAATIFVVIGESVLKLSLYLAALLLAIGAADFGFQKWKHERDLMMTREELKEELKNQEGDPRIRRRRRDAHRKLVESRNVYKVSLADFLLANPTHVSLAFKYDPPKYSVPTVIAKGADEIALRMRQIAAEHAVPVIERPELARQLYKSLEVGDGIPVELYDVFIEILKYVYTITGRTMDLSQVTEDAA